MGDPPVAVLRKQPNTPSYRHRGALTGALERLKRPHKQLTFDLKIGT